MRKFIDLHTHSTASDGCFSPGELVRLADAEGLAVLALTDHDTIEGLREARQAAATCPDLRFVAGIEVSAAFPAGVLHLLGLGIDESAPAVRELSETLREARDKRNPKVIARLNELGVALSFDDVLAALPRASAGSDRPIVSRMHIAEALRRKGVVGSTREAFDRYIGSGAPAYLDKERLPAGEVIAAIRAAGGIAALAHPVQLRCENSAQLERIVRNLVHHGLEGLEVYHSQHTPERTRRYLDLARRFGLLITGGSDFHGWTKPHASLGLPRVPLAALDGPLADRLLKH